MDARERADCAGSADFEGDPLTVPNGAYACEVEVDPDTGATTIAAFTGVDDVGRRLNPAVVAGQLHGAIAQGIGQAMLERMVYDAAGQLLTGSLADYALPRADDLPEFRLHANDRPTNANMLGCKGVGELGCIGAPGAVMSAITDAIGTEDIEMPATPERVWQAFNRRKDGS
jgi:carbon-monoxide dehydrogenase large subunit